VAEPAAGVRAQGAAGSARDEFGDAGSGIELPQALARSADAVARLAHVSSRAPSGPRSALSGPGSLSTAGRSLARADTRSRSRSGSRAVLDLLSVVALGCARLAGPPFLLAQAWAFVARAIAAAERRAVRPLLILAPALVAAGAGFGYFVVLPPAVGFLHGFAHGAFDVLVSRARRLLRFASTTKKPQPRPVWPRFEVADVGTSGRRIATSRTPGRRRNAANSRLSKAGHHRRLRQAQDRKVAPALLHAPPLPTFRFSRSELTRLTSRRMTRAGAAPAS